MVSRRRTRGRIRRSPCAGRDTVSPGSRDARRRIRGGLAFDVRVGGDHHLVNLALGDARLELADTKLVRADAIHRGERAAEHVVKAVKLSAPLHRENIERFLNNA